MGMPMREATVRYTLSTSNDSTSVYLNTSGANFGSSSPERGSKPRTPSTPTVGSVGSAEPVGGARRFCAFRGLRCYGFARRQEGARRATVGGCVVLPDLSHLEDSTMTA
eukprot:1194692-Prorocentrum_minimum.AAC.4